MLLLHMSRQRKNQNQREADQPHHHVRRVQSHQRVERRAEQICSDRQPVHINQLVPLQARAHEKIAPSAIVRPTTPRTHASCRAQSPLREPDCHTARKQADGVEARNLQNLLRRRSAEAFADIKNVGDDEDGEDRALADDQRQHGHAPARGQAPRFRSRETWESRSCFVLPVRIFGMFQIPQRTAAVHLRDRSRSCIPAAAKASPIPASRHPRDRCPPACRGNTTAPDSTRRSDRDALNEPADRDDQIQVFQPRSGS